MVRLQGAFLVRCWLLQPGGHRIEIEHVRSGDRTRVHSVAAALEWITRQVEDSGPGPDGDTPVDQVLE